MFTDGLVERRDRPFDVGIDHIVDLLSAMPNQHSPSDVTEALLDALSEGAPAEDDIAVLVIQHVPRPRRLPRWCN